MNEELIDSLKSDITNLQTAVHILNDNTKHLVIRNEIMLCVISAMIDSGGLTRGAITNFVNSLNFDNHQFSDIQDIAEIEKTSVIKLLSKVKTFE